MKWNRFDECEPSRHVGVYKILVSCIDYTKDNKPREIVICDRDKYMNVLGPRGAYFHNSYWIRIPEIAED